MLIKEDVINKLRTSKYIYFTNSRATNLPFVECDPDTFNDQVWIFATEDDAKVYFEKKVEQKIALLGGRVENHELNTFYTQLHFIGVNALVWCEGDESMEVMLDEVAPIALSEEELQQLPPMNPVLQLSAIYFMQEYRRPVPMEEHIEHDIHMLEEEMLVNICKSNFFMVMQPNPENPEQHGPIILKNKDGEPFLTLYTDTNEIARFLKKDAEGTKLFHIPFEKLKDILPEDITGIVINPAGFNLPVFREQVMDLIGDGDSSDEE